MGKQTGIEWTDHTFNPWWGCIKVSPACDHCYAATLSKRYGFDLWGKDTDRRFFGDKHWNEPMRWNKDALSSGERRRVFCGSMCDVMEDRDDLKPLRFRLFRLIEETPCLDWQLLTKRPQNFRKFLPAAWIENPRPNVWGMTTVESDMYRWRVSELIETPFSVRGLSCEPLVSSLNLSQLLYTGAIHWVITGGESGHSARPSHPDWFLRLRDQCRDANVPFFMKQWGNWAPTSQIAATGPISYAMTADGRVSAFNQEDMKKIAPEVTRWEGLRNVGKKNSGALLDDVSHKAFPVRVEREA